VAGAAVAGAAVAGAAVAGAAVAAGVVTGSAAVVVGPSTVDVVAPSASVVVLLARRRGGGTVGGGAGRGLAAARGNTEKAHDRERGESASWRHDDTSGHSAGSLQPLNTQVGLLNSLVDTVHHGITSLHAAGDAPAGPGGRLRRAVRAAHRPSGARGQRLLRDRAATASPPPRWPPSSRAIILSGGPKSVHVEGAPVARPRHLRPRRPHPGHLLRRPAHRPAARRHRRPRRRGEYGRTKDLASRAPDRRCSAGWPPPSRTCG
jgi:hypothetical protein